MRFVRAAFDTEELFRVADESERIGHAEARIVDSIVMMFDGPARWRDTPAFMRLYVPDGKAAYRQALEAGATSITRPTHLFFGDVVRRVRDPFDNVWLIHERVEEVDEEETARRLQDPEWIARMAYVQGAEIVL